MITSSNQLRALIAAVCIAVVSFFSCTGNEELSLKFAVASNMVEPMDSLLTVFELQSGISCTQSSNATGILTAQILTGAPYEVLIAAGNEYPDQLKTANLANDIYTFANARLIVAGNLDFRDSLKQVLFHPAVKKIGIADPEIAPFGIAAEAYLRKMGWFGPLQPKIVHGESIAQLNQYLNTGAVDVAFTGNVLKATCQDKFSYYELDSTDYHAIPVVCCHLNKSTHKNEILQNFREYLLSPGAKSILEHFGYLSP